MFGGTGDELEEQLDCEEDVDDQIRDEEDVIQLVVVVHCLCRGRTVHCDGTQHHPNGEDAVHLGIQDTFMHIDATCIL